MNSFSPLSTHPFLFFHLCLSVSMRIHTCFIHFVPLHPQLHSLLIIPLDFLSPNPLLKFQPPYSEFVITNVFFSHPFTPHAFICLPGTLMILKSACSYNASYIDRLISVFMRSLQKMVREHLSPQQANPGATETSTGTCMQMKPVIRYEEARYSQN